MRRMLHPLALCLLLSACKQQLSGDANLQKQLTGTWSSWWGGGSLTNVTTVSADGHYSRIGVGTNGMVLARCEGVLKVQDGCLVDTMTKHSEPNVPLPYTNRAAIVRAGDREWALKRYSSEKNETILLRKESR